MSANISIFVPHLGCRYKCSFCNQFSITEMESCPTTEDVISTVETGLLYLGEKSEESEIAFFGGSFTAIDREYMISLLDTASKYVKEGKIKGIRISTRPDEIDEERLEILKDYGVTSIELGAQSMCDDVLLANHRGHTAEDVRFASRLIKSYGFELGLQMMTGLYKSNDEKDLFTVKEIIDIKPDTVRIYPTVLLKNTYLYKLFLDEKYQPQQLEDAINLCSEFIPMFNATGIKIIRVGLHSIDSNNYVAGPWHPAFGELCESRIFRNKLDKEIEKDCVVFCNPFDLSKIIGQKRENINYFRQKNINIKVEKDATIEKGNFKISEVNGK